MMNPVLGKEFFELLSLVVSSINGCEMCVTLHEKNLVGHGTEKQRIHDAVRLGAVIKSLTATWTKLASARSLRGFPHENCYS
ncbi:MAG: hypothetical protein EON55_13170, partial [Alphaproteobacteria bacterium]